MASKKGEFRISQSINAARKAALEVLKVIFGKYLEDVDYRGVAHDCPITDGAKIQYRSVDLTVNTENPVDRRLGNTQFKLRVELKASVPVFEPWGWCVVSVEVIEPRTLTRKFEGGELVALVDPVRRAQTEVVR